MPTITIGRGYDDLQKYGPFLGTGFIGRHLVGEKKEAHAANPVRLDLARPHVIGVFGKRGSGKSYTLAVIAEELLHMPPEIKDNVSVILIDTMGIYWSMKYPNDREVTLLDKWNLKPEALETTHYIPEGQVRIFRENDIPFDKTFMLNPGELSASDWAMAFKLKPNEEISILLERAIRNLKIEKWNSYSLEDIIESVRETEGFDKRVKDALENKFLMAMDWGVFSENGTPIEELLQRGKSTVLDVSLYGDITGGWSVRTLIVGLLAKRILRERMRARRVEEIEEMEGTLKSEMPIVWMILDEAHTFVPQKGETPASVPLQQWVKLGREPGVSLVVATQMPNKLHEDIIAQMDIVISHRLTAKSDVDHLRNIMQTYMRYDLATLLDNLPRMPGVAICLDDNSERVYAIQVRPRLSWHGGGTPIAIKKIPAREEKLINENV